MNIIPKHKTIAEMKLTIMLNIFFEIKREEYVRVIDNFSGRLQEYLRQNDGHLKHVLYLINLKI